MINPCGYIYVPRLGDIWTVMWPQRFCVKIHNSYILCQICITFIPIDSWDVLFSMCTRNLVVVIMHVIGEGGFSCVNMEICSRDFTIAGVNKYCASGITFLEPYLSKYPLYNWCTCTISHLGIIYSKQKSAFEVTWSSLCTTTICRSALPHTIKWSFQIQRNCSLWSCKSDKKHPSDSFFPAILLLLTRRHKTYRYCSSFIGRCHLPTEFYDNWDTFC